MSKIKVGIIGTGGISHVHMSGYKKAADKAEVVAVCDINEQRVKEYAKHYNVGRYYVDFNEMLEKENLDAVDVCTWNNAHAPATIAALNAGCDVLCEKPMAMNQAEAELMEAAAVKNNKMLMIGFVRRFGRDTAIVKDFIDKGFMGDIYYAKANYLRRNGCPGGWFGDKSYSGGGPLIDLGVHIIDITRYLAGCPQPISAYGAAFNNLGMNRATSGGEAMYSTDTSANVKFKYDVEDFATALVRFDNGFVLSVEASFNLNIKQDDVSVDLYGTKGGIKIDPTLEFYTDMNGHFVNMQPDGASHSSFEGIFEEEIAHFADCVIEKKQPRSTAGDGVALMKIIDAIYESARIGAEVKIK